MPLALCYVLLGIVALCRIQQLFAVFPALPTDAGPSTAAACDDEPA